MKINIPTILMLFFCQMSLFAQSEMADQFSQANELYKQKKYTEAVNLYEGILQAEMHSAELHFNLGNSYYQNKQLGKAILHYEKALFLDPGDEDIQYNLVLAQEQRIDEIEVLPPFFLANWWQNMRQAASSTIWGIIGLLLLFAGAGGFVFYLIGNSRKHKKLGFIGGIVAMLICILPFSLAYSRAKIEMKSGTAIILQKQIDLKSGPDEASTTLNQLHEGTKVILLDDIGEWHQVRLVNGEIGWLTNTSFEGI